MSASTTIMVRAAKGRVQIKAKGKRRRFISGRCIFPLQCDFRREILVISSGGNNADRTRADKTEVDKMGSGNETEVQQVPVQRERIMVDLLNPDTCPPALKKFYTDTEREAIKMAIEAGNVITEQRNVKVSKDKSGTGKEELWPYLLYRAVKGPGMTALGHGRTEVSKKKPTGAEFDALNDNAKKRAENDAKDGACDYFNYGFSLTIMQPIRTLLTNSLGGVDKEIDKQVTQIMRTGLYLTEADAREAVIAQREKLGLEIPALAEEA